MPSNVQYRSNSNRNQTQINNAVSNRTVVSQSREYVILPATELTVGDSFSVADSLHYFQSLLYRGPLN
jgi:hypothetical protein